MLDLIETSTQALNLATLSGVSGGTLAATLADATQAVVSTGGDMKVWAYIGFVGLVVVFLALDLGVFHREAHEVSMKEAVSWSVVWLTLGLLFGVFVYFAYERHWLGLGLNTPMYADTGAIVMGEITGKVAAQQYVTGYIIEKSLAMDNIFVIALLFSFFAVPAKYQHRVLFWGIIGALLMRGGMIFLGAELIQAQQWVLIIFGGFLVLTAVKMAVIKSESDPSQNIVVKLVKKFFPVTEFYDGQKFLTKRTLKPTYSIDPKTGKEVMDPPPAGSLRATWAITPLMLALIMVEITDLVFAVDSIPAIFAITPDPFIVFTSNIFAILGLRALYFCLAAMIAKFRYLKPALILILAFVGIKLLLLSVPPYLDTFGSWIGQTWNEANAIKIPTGISLMAVVGALVLAVIASVLNPAKEDPKSGNA
ncbi:MAG: TerC family protein [Planctomycetota bacterium]|nr:TerC family protein [Planctomycetota bacterium]